MILNIIVDFKKVHPFEKDESIVLFKSIQSDFVPRVNDYIQDPGFEEELLVKKVIWNHDTNSCDVETKLVGSTKTLDAVKENALSLGWKIIQ